MMRATLLSSMLLFAACPDGGAPGGNDLAVPDLGGIDLANQIDLATGCSPNDPMTDGQDCAAQSCPNGTIGVTDGAKCTCRLSCAPGMQGDCPCSRRCVTLTSGDGGVVGAACLPSNGAGERCGRDMSNMPFGFGGCAQGLVCASQVANAPAYCLHVCGGQVDCPQQTTCSPITGPGGQPMGNACTYNYGQFGKDPGQGCLPNLDCKTGLFCANGVCQSQCDGPSATCAVGICKDLRDPVLGKIVGYYCQQ
jgi:hypothetical protein